MAIIDPCSHCHAPVSHEDLSPYVFCSRPACQQEKERRSQQDRAALDRVVSLDADPMQRLRAAGYREVAPLSFRRT